MEKLSQKEFDQLTFLLDKYFSKEFEVYRKFSDAIYKDADDLDSGPLRFLRDLSDYTTVFDEMDEALMSHIRYTFLLQNELPSEDKVDLEKKED